MVVIHPSLRSRSGFFPGLTSLISRPALRVDQEEAEVHCHVSSFRINSLCCQFIEGHLDVTAIKIFTRVRIWEQSKMRGNFWCILK